MSLEQADFIRKRWDKFQLKTDFIELLFEGTSYDWNVSISKHFINLGMAGVCLRPAVWKGRLIGFTAFQNDNYLDYIRFKDLDAFSFLEFCRDVRTEGLRRRIYG